MKKIGFLLFAALIALQVVTMAQAVPNKHRIVFELTSADPAEWEAVLNNVENLQKAFGPANTEIEVVTHGKGLALLRNTNANMAERLKRIAGSGVVFAACNNTMQRMKITKQDMFPFVAVVDSGVAEVVRKQEAGWSYIKGGL